MIEKPWRGLFVAGTDTAVGKTYVAAIIARRLHAEGHRVGVYKPAASGCRREGGEVVSDDALELWHAAGQPGDLEAVCPQRFLAPLMPHLAAQAEERRVNAVELRRGLDAWKGCSEVMVVEGAGGLLSPLSEQDYVIDLAREFGFPLVLVAANRIGVVNQVLSALFVAEQYRGGLPVAGVVLNCLDRAEDDPSVESNLSEIARRARVPVLGEVAYQAGDIRPAVDWKALAGVARGA